MKELKELKWNAVSDFKAKKLKELTSLSNVILKLKTDKQVLGTS